MNKRLLFWLKLLVLLAVALLVVWQLYKAWQKVGEKHLTIDWSWGAVALAGFAGSMVTSALVWRFLTRRMGDRSPALPLLASYTYSQMGKYIPGKVVLLLMRIERTSRFGMTPSTCTLSTLLENALYMISGGLIGMTAIVRITREIDNPQTRALLWPVTILAVLLLMAACSPRVFYGLVNRLLRKMKKPEVLPRDRLRAPTLALAVVAFIPCWCFGGLAMWGSLRCVSPVSVPLSDCWWFAGAYALSVIIGMASLLPGGTGIRDAALGAAATFQLAAAGVQHDRAVLLGFAVAVLQRIFQVLVEVALGLTGMVLSRKPSAKGATSDNRVRG
jgi:glycosyltransferase 2 family protein